MISKQNLPMKNTFRTYQHFKKIFTVLLRRKSQVVVKKTVLFSAIIRIAFGNENWSKNKTNFVVWKNYMLIVFWNKIYLSYFLFILSFKRHISIRIERKKNLESFETLRLNTTFSLKVLLSLAVLLSEEGILNTD